MSQILFHKTSYYPAFGTAAATSLVQRWGSFFSRHRVLVHDYSRPVKLQANNQEVPFDALVAKVNALFLILTSFDLQTFGKPSAPPAGIEETCR